MMVAARFVGIGDGGEAPSSEALTAIGRMTLSYYLVFGSCGPRP